MSARPSPLTGRRRLAAAVVSTGIVLTAVPALAGPPRDDEQSAALVLLADAAQSSRSLSYTGTQYLATWGPAGSTTALVEVEHAPGRGSSLRTGPEPGSGDRVRVAAAPLDERLLDVLQDRYLLRVVGDGHCAGRDAQVVEARRPGRTGASALAGRFWVDRETGLLLRREVFDTDGRRLRSSAFLDLTVSASPSTVPFAPMAAGSPSSPRRDGGTDQLPPARLQQMRTDGWTVPAALPEGFALFDARLQDHGGAQVLHLAYSDGLSTTSLFSQPGSLGGTPPEGFGVRSVAGEPVWESPGAPRRMVWAGGGRVWTLVSDAPSGAVSGAVEALPHEALPDDDDGWGARLGRGLRRLADALPFG